MTALLGSRAMEVVGLVLLHSLWQGLVVAAAAGLALAFVRGAAARYRIACLGLLALLAWPALTGIDLASDGPVSTRARAVASEAEVADEASSVAASPAVASVARAAVVTEGEPGGARPQPSVAEPAPAPSEDLRARLVPSLAVLWCLGVLLGLLRLALGLVLVARLRRSGRPAGAATVQAARRIASSVGLRARVVVLETHRLAAPVVVGVVRPVVLLPLGLGSSLPPAQLEAVLAHELAHVLRRDYLVNLLQRLAETLLFHHPAAWWLSTVVRTEREHLCDDAAVRAVGGDPLPLARALAALERGRRGPPIAAMGARGARGAPGDLLGRVRRLLGRGPARRRPGLAPVALQGGLPALLLAAVAVFAPAVAQVGQAATEAREGRYGVLVRAGRAPEAYVQVARPEEGEGDGPLRLVAPEGEPLRFGGYRTTPSAWSANAPLERLEALRVSFEGGEGVLDLPVPEAATVAPPRPRIDEPDEDPTPIYDEEGRIGGWEGGVGPALVWDPVQGAEAYHVAVEAAPWTSWPSLHHPDDEGGILPGSITSFSLAAFPPGEYLLRVHAFSAPPDLGGGVGLRRVDEAISATVTYLREEPAVAPDVGGAASASTAPAPFHLRYGRYLNGYADPQLYLHLDLAPNGRSSAGPATVQIFGDTGAPLATFDVEGTVRSGGYPVDPAAVAGIGVATAGGTWWVPVELAPAQEGFEPVSGFSTAFGSSGGSGVLVWDPVPGARVYEVGFFPAEGGPGHRLSTAEPRVPLAGLDEGSYAVRVWAYSRNPDVPAQLLPIDVAVLEDAMVVEVSDPVGEPEPGRVEGVVRVGDEPTARAPVGLFRVQGGRHSRSDRRLVSTDAAGRFAFEDVPPGRYGVSVEVPPPPGPTALPWPVPFTTVAVAAGATTTVPDLYAVPPIEPTGALARGTTTAGEVLLSWEPVPGAVAYRVALREGDGARASDGAGTLLASDTVDTPGWTVRLEGGEVHEVTVEALDAEGVRVGRLGVELRTTPSR